MDTRRRNLTEGIALVAGLVAGSLIVGISSGTFPWTLLLGMLLGTLLGMAALALLRRTRRRHH